MSWTRISLAIVQLESNIISPSTAGGIWARPENFADVISITLNHNMRNAEGEVVFEILWVPMGIYGHHPSSSSNTITDAVKSVSNSATKMAKCRGDWIDSQWPSLPKLVINVPAEKSGKVHGIIDSQITSITEKPKLVEKRRHLALVPFNVDMSLK